MDTTRFPPTPFTTIPGTLNISRPTPLPTSVNTLITNTSNLSTAPTGQQNGSSNTILSSLWSTTLPQTASNTGLSNFDLSTPTLPVVMMSSTTVTVAQGLFGAGASIDPLIIFGLIMAGLVLLFLLGAIIYCCCRYCGAATGQPVIQRTASFQTIRQMPTLTRKQYLYPADVVGYGNDVTYNTMRPRIVSGGTPIITTLGDGYALGHSLRSTGNRYSARNLIFYEDDPAPQIITLY